MGWRIAGLLPDVLSRLVCAEEGEANDADGGARRGLIMSFGTFFRYYDEHLLLGATDTTIGLIGGIQAFIILLLSFVVGRLLDAKLHRVIVGVGGVLTSLGYFCLSFTSLRGPENQANYGLIILTQSIIAGVGMSCFFTHSSHCAIQVRKEPARGNISEADIFVEWFPHHKYFAVGITSAGAAVGKMGHISSRMLCLLKIWQEALRIHWRSPISSANTAFLPVSDSSPQSSVESLLYASSSVLQIRHQRNGQ